MGSQTSTTNQSSSSSPWAPQAAALTTAFGDANTALGQAQGATAPTNFTAQFTPDQLNTFNSMLGYANNNTTPGQVANTASSSMTNGTNATQGALTGLTGYNAGNTNNTQSLINSANQYVAGQNIPAEVNNAMQSADQQANEVTLPQLEQGAAMSGNTNSSRTGIADGLVQQGLAEQAANLSGTLQSNAFTNGLNLAETQANQNNTDNLGALSGLGSLGNATTNTGVNAGTSSINDQTGLYNLAENAGTGQQNAEQANLTNQQQQYQAQTQDPFAALQQYMGIVGSGNWGSNSTGTAATTTTPSALQMISGLLGTAGQAINLFP